MKAAAYVRVSSRQQSLEAQKSAILKAASARGDEITDWYGEKASAYIGERAELAALRAAVRRGEHRKVYVFRIDRLSRSGVLSTFTIANEFKVAGCALVTVADSFELDSVAGPIILAVLATCAQMEREAMADRINAARERARAAGLDWGRPRVLLDDTIRIAAKRVAGGESVRKAAVELGVSHRTLHRALKRVAKATG